MAHAGGPRTGDRTLNNAESKLATAARLDSPQRWHQNIDWCTHTFFAPRWCRGISHVLEVLVNADRQGDKVCLRLVRQLALVLALRISEGHSLF